MGLLLIITFTVVALLLVLVLPHFLHNARATTLPVHRSKQDHIVSDDPMHHEVGLPDDLPDAPPPPPEADRVPFVNNQALFEAIHRPAPWHPAHYNTSHRSIPLTLIAEPASREDSKDSTKEQQAALL